MKKLPKGIQNIREIIEKGYLYIDKTGLATQLIDLEKYVFMSRPRRFGKSLFLSTLDEIFKGNKELFKGYKIYDSDYDWEDYPVLRFDFYRINTSSFEEELKNAIKKMAVKKLGKELNGLTVESLLEDLIECASETNPVVILVDEYDHAIVNHLNDTETIEANRETLRSFFGTIKSLDEHVRFSFVTGVTKFSQTTLFSGPNQYTDITFLPAYAEMMGYTHEEILAGFAPHIQAMATSRGMDNAAVIDEMRTWYNGYRFSDKEHSVYNPYSTILYFSSLTDPKGYWYNSGTPKFLFNEIAKRKSLVNLRGIEASERQLSEISTTRHIDLIALLFQTGYLTIKAYERRGRRNYFHLHFPNFEVRDAFFESLLVEIGKVERQQVEEVQTGLKHSIESGRLSDFFKQIQSVFSGIPYQINREQQFESTYHSILLALLVGSDIFAQGEVSVNFGRIDLLVDTEDALYLFELKLDQSADAALCQIKEKEYAYSFRERNKKIVLVGVNFSTKEKNLQEWKSEEFSGDY